MSPLERKYINQVMDSDRISYGQFTPKFEKMFAALHDSKYAMFCNSGTSALQVAVQALKEIQGWEDGDEIIVPAVTFVATANVVLHNRMKPVFIDVERRTYNIDPDLIEARITPRTRAIIPVHLMGLPADMNPILDIAKRHNLKVIEDSCETVFARYQGRAVGSMGDIGCFSTYVCHYIVTGVGGVATCSDPEIVVKLKSLMNHGRDSIYLRAGDGNGKKGNDLYSIVARRFKFDSVGHSFRATEFEAALGMAQLEQKDRLIKKRLEIAARLTAGLEQLNSALQLPFVPPDRDHVFMLYPIVLRDPGANKRDLVNYLEKNGIETRDLMPLINQPIYTRLYGEMESQYPVAKWLNKSGFYIGCHPYLSNNDVDFVIDKLRRFFR